MCDYLTNMPTDVLNTYGLTKTLLTRRETIYLKHVMKNIFIYGNEELISDKINTLQFKSLFQYMGFVTNKLRGIYKLPREYKTDNADHIVKQNRDSFFRNLELYRDIKPIIVLDFDKTITNTNFHSLYKHIINNYAIIINSANPQKEAIENYLIKNELPMPKIIYANKGKQKKITRLKDIAMHYQDKVIFYIDDEEEYLDYGCLLFMYCYKYSKNGKIKCHTIFKK
jgi:hypothetical protein